MKEVSCRIKGSKEIGGKEYIVVEDVQDLSEHVLPADDYKYLYTEENETKKFYKEFNSKMQKFFITPVHPFYKIRKEYEFPIKGLRSDTNQQNKKIYFFQVEDKDKNILDVKAFKWQLRDKWKNKSLLCEIKTFRSGKPVLINKDVNHPSYVVKKEYSFPIVGFDFFINKRNEKVNTIKVIDLDENIISVIALPWQNERIWRYDSLTCEVKDFRNGIPVLINIDFRHPYYKVGGEYSFKIKGFKTKKAYGGDSEVFEVFEVQGDDGCIHEVNTSPGQVININEINKVRCEVVSIRHYIRLRQIIDHDPYFKKVENIIPDKKLISKYFNPVIEGNSNIKNRKLLEQYKSQSAFWIFTFCNKVLPELFYESINRFEYKRCIELNKMMLLCEEWIIHGGIITSFPDEKAKQNTARRAKQQVESCKIKGKVLKALQSLAFDDFYTSLTDSKSAVRELYYLHRFSNILIIDDALFINKLTFQINSGDLNEEAIHYLQKLDQLITIRKKLFLNRKFEQQFNLTTTSDGRFLNIEHQNKYLNWLYCQYYINYSISNFERANLLLGELLRKYFYVVADLNLKEKVLYNAYYVLNNYQLKLKQSFFSFEETVALKEDNLLTNPNFHDYPKESWEKVIESYESEKHIIVKVIKKYPTGLEVDFHGIKGFLPNHHVKDASIRRYQHDSISFTIAARVINISKDFKDYIIAQLDPDDPGYLSTNNYNNHFTEGAVTEGIVIGFEDYGVFLSSPFGEGLLHKSKISHHYYDKEILSRLFPAKEKVKLVIQSKNKQNKLNFSFIDLEKTEFAEQYTKFIEKVELGDLEDLEEYDLENLNEDVIDKIEEDIQANKAFCYEQYALMQDAINVKLHYLSLAKQYFSTINSARSYLINIYSDYFRILLFLKEIINSFSLERLSEVKVEAEKVKGRINLKTLETFPDTEKLVYFLDIISLFNEKTDEKNYELFEYVKKYSSEKGKEILKTVAKITLSNNLLISETNDVQEFSLANLKRISAYLENGVLSLSDTEIDKVERELKKKIRFWRNKIQEEESQTVELKSSFLVPILDKGAKIRLEKLKGLKDKTDKVKKDIDRINGDLAKKAVMHSALKTLAGFANTTGGTLLLGISDDKKILGLEQDFNSLKQKDRDGFGKLFDDTIKNYLGESFSSLLVREFIKFPEGDVLVITVKPSGEEVFILKDEEGKDTEDIYIRNLSSTVSLKGKELVKFLKNRQKEQIRRSIEVSE